MLKIIVFIKSKKGKKEKIFDRAKRKTWHALWNTLDAGVKCCKTVKHSRIYLNQILLWIMINFDGFGIGPIFVLRLLVSLSFFFNLGSQGMALKASFGLSLSPQYLCLSFVFWCYFDVDCMILKWISWILNLESMLRQKIYFWLKEYQHGQ